jgi:hypothetical protein
MILSRFMGDYRRGFGLANGFIDHVYTRIGTTSSYSATAYLHNSQITTASARPFQAFCVFISSSLTTASNSRDSSASRAHSLRYRTHLSTDSNWLLTGSPQLSSLQPLCMDRVENIVSNSNSIVVFLFVAAGTCLPTSCLDRGCITPLFIRILHSNVCTR